MNKIENDFSTSSPTLIFVYKNRFQKDIVDFWTKDFTLKTENVKFLTSTPQVVLQDIKKILLGGSMGCRKLLKFTCLTMKFHNHHQT